MQLRWLLFVVSMAGALALAGCARVQAEQSNQRAESGFALVELFTSEGCSSCPPADALLADLERDAAAAHQPVYTLSFHVDYWDRLGWRDPWSAPWASARQRAYAAALGGQGVYTPQMIVNGQRAFVGSRSGQAQSAIEAALAQSAALKLTVDTSQADGALNAAVQLSAKPPANSVLRVALVERETTSRVTQGENEGRELVHTNVVREFQTEALNGRTQVRTRLEWPSNLAKERAALVVYIQDSQSQRIIAGTRRDAL